MTKFVATVNVPGYLPQEDEPAVFDTAREAWAYLRDERMGDEVGSVDSAEYSDTVRYLDYCSGNEVKYGNPHEDWPLAADGTGTIYGDTPGYYGKHDLGLAYSVSVVE